MDDMAKKSASAAPGAELAQLPSLDLDELVRIWKVRIGRKVPLHLPRYLLVRLLAYRLQAQASGNLDRSLRSQLEQFAPEKLAAHRAKSAAGGETEARERPGPRTPGRPSSGRGD